MNAFEKTASKQRLTTLLKEKLATLATAGKSGYGSGAIKAVTKSPLTTTHRAAASAAGFVKSLKRTPPGKVIAQRPDKMRRELQREAEGNWGR